MHGEDSVGSCLNVDTQNLLLFYGAINSYGKTVSELRRRLYFISEARVAVYVKFS